MANRCVKVYQGYLSLALLLFTSMMTSTLVEASESSVVTPADHAEYNIGHVDQKLFDLEQIRTQEPEKVTEELVRLNELYSLMNKEQQYRLILLQSHSYALSGYMDKSLGLLSQNIENPFQENLLHFKARMLYLQANIYSHYNRYIESLKSLHQLLPLLNEVDDVESEVYGYSLAVELFQGINLKSEAIRYSNILYDKYSKLKLPRHKCFTLYSYVSSRHGIYSSDLSQLAELENLYQQAYSQCELANEKMMMALSLLGEAEILIQREEYKKAKMVAKKALLLSNSIPYNIIIVESYLLLAEVEYKEGSLPESLFLTNMALDLVLKINDEALMVKVYLLLSTISEDLNNVEKALEYLKLYQQHYSNILGDTQSKIIAFETTKLDYLEKERQIRYLNKDRELYTAKAELTESQRNNERMMLLLIFGSLIVLTLFAINMTLQKRKYKNLAQFDVLTGIYNRGTGQDKAENRYVKDSISGVNFSVILFDLDHFKNINDSYGHAMGDWALKKVCEVVSIERRSGDIFTRFGGEEFALFMSNTDNDTAKKVAEKCRLQILAIETRYSGHEFTISASFGVATSTVKDLSLDPIIQRADIAMYQSKEQGRDRVSVFSDEMA